MNIFLQIIAIFIIYLTTMYATYRITDRGLPQWLGFRPWTCWTCLSFWTLTAAYMTLWLSFGCLYTGAGGIMLAVLNAIAMKVEQKQRTITIEEFDKYYD